MKFTSLSFCYFCSGRFTAFRAKAAIMASDRHQCTRNVPSSREYCDFAKFIRVWFANLPSSCWFYSAMTLSVAIYRYINGGLEDYVEISKKWSSRETQYTISYFDKSAYQQ